MTLYLGSKICKICFKRYLRRSNNYRKLIKNKNFVLQNFLNKFPDINTSPPHVEGSADHSDEHIGNGKKIKKKTSIPPGNLHSHYLIHPHSPHPYLIHTTLQEPEGASRPTKTPGPPPRNSDETPIRRRRRVC